MLLYGYSLSLCIFFISLLYSFYHNGELGKEGEVEMAEAVLRTG